MELGPALREDSTLPSYCSRSPKAVWEDVGQVPSPLPGSPGCCAFFSSLGSFSMLLHARTKMPISFHFESFFLLAVPTPTQGDGQEPFIHPTEPPRMSGTGRGGERWTPTGSQPGAGEKVRNEQLRQWMRAGPEHGLLAAGTRKVDVEAWGPGRDSGTEVWARWGWRRGTWPPGLCLRVASRWDKLCRGAGSPRLTHQDPAVGLRPPPARRREDSGGRC